LSLSPTRLIKLPLRLTEQGAPTVEPMLVATAKDHLKVTDTADDTLITNLIVAARQRCEDYTGRALITQTWQAFMDQWPFSNDADALWEGTRTGPESIITGRAEGIVLPKPPLASVTHIKTYDDADVATTFAASNYFVDTATEPGRIVLRSGSSWPNPSRVANGIEVQFVCGYGVAGSIPDDLMSGMLMLIGHLYENRAEVQETNANQMPWGVRSLWDSKRIIEVG